GAAEVLRGRLTIEHLTVEPRRRGRVALACVRAAQRRERLVLAAVGRQLDGFGEMLTRVFVAALQVERDTGAEMRVEQVGRSLQRLAVQGERFVLFSFAVQLARLLHELD